MKPKKPKSGESLLKVNPELARQWHPDRNGNLSPRDVTPGSNKRVWWKCPEGDDHEWYVSVLNRNAGSGCPVCSGRKVVKSNCLATLNPELTKEWHPTKNGTLTPYDVTPTSHKKVWWKCPKGDDHEWDALISDRNKGIGCAICSNYKVVNSNCLSTLNPLLASEWHPTKNGKLTPNDVHPGSAKRVWWKCPKGDDHEWKALVYSRSGGRGCPICSGRKVVKSNCLSTLNPNLAKEWHPTKNGKLTSNDVGINSHKKVWWKCPKGEDHEWKASIGGRTIGYGCPICSNLKIVRSNCLAVLNPELAKQWHPTKNGTLTPFDVGPGSGKRVWWQCPEGKDHVWKAPIARRNNEIFCPICRGRRVVESNSLGFLFPIIAEQWHPMKNKDLTPSDVRPGSIKKVWWVCPIDDSHIWKTSIKERTNGTNCPMCFPQTSIPELRLFCEFKFIFPTTQQREVIEGYEVDIYIPEIKVGIEYDGFYWHKDRLTKDQEKNSALQSQLFLIRIREKGLPKISKEDIILSDNKISVNLIKILIGKFQEKSLFDSNRKIVKYMKCKNWQGTETFTKLQTVRNYIEYEKTISFLYPELVKQWHPLKNGNLKPEHFTPGSDKRIWWKCPEGDDHEWESTISNRIKNEMNCPICSNKKAVLSNCLATMNPELAKQWHPEKNGSLTPFNVTPGSNKKIWWKCPEGVDHVWEAFVYSRSSGQGCPVCSGRKAVNSNSLGTLYPEIAQQWHEIKNGDLTPFNVTPGSHKVVWWQDHTGKEWQASVNGRTRNYRQMNNSGQLSLFDNKK